jgi:hypothetical protein
MSKLENIGFGLAALLIMLLSLLASFEQAAIDAAPFIEGCGDYWNCVSETWLYAGWNVVSYWMLSTFALLMVLAFIYELRKARKNKNIKKQVIR